MRYPTETTNLQLICRNRLIECGTSIYQTELRFKQSGKERLNLAQANTTKTVDQAIWTVPLSTMR